MKRTHTRIGLLTLSFVAFIFFPNSAHAIDKGTIEIGVDGVLTVTTFTGRSWTPDNATDFSIPARVRYGTFTGDDTELDILLNFVSSNQGSRNLTALEMNLGVAFHPSKKSEGAVSFIEPMAGFRLVSLGSFSDFQLLVGAETGYKLMNKNGLAARLSASVIHAFETSSTFGSTTYGVTFGVSFFVKKKGLYSY